MIRRAFLVIFLSTGLCRAGQEGFHKLTLEPTDRVLVLAPHPDDEVLGTGGILQRAAKMKLPVRVVFLTNGDANKWAFTVYRKRPVLSAKEMRVMGEVRRREAVSACEMLGLSKNDLIFLGYPDHGTMKVWAIAWDGAQAFRSGLTNTDKVPYLDAYRPGAPYKGQEILNDLRELLKDFKPTKIFVAHPADENPDHRAAYLFLRVALWDLEKEIRPQIYPFLVHYRFRHWPQPLGFHPDQALVLPLVFSNAMTQERFDLNREEIDTKYMALKMHKTQFRYSGKYLSSFVRLNEIYCDFPTFTVTRSQPAHLEERELVASTEWPEEMPGDEYASEIDLEKREAAVEDGAFVLTVFFKRPLKEKTRLSIFLFGYRPDKPFTEMPKIHVEIGRMGQKFMDGPNKLPIGAIELVRAHNQIKIKIPLKVLGHPDRLLTGVQSTLEDFPLDCMAWRTLMLAQ